MSEQFADTAADSSGDMCERLVAGEAPRVTNTVNITYSPDPYATPGSSGTCSASTAGVGSMAEPTAPLKTPEEQVEWWMDRYFKLQDEHAEAVTALAQIRAIVNAHHNVPGGEVGSRSAEAPVNEQRPPRQGTA